MDRFSVVYRISGDEETALERARDICIEQTVEFPPELVPYGFVQDVVMGQITRFRPDREGSCRVTISYDVNSSAFELTQLFNVIFGNISIKPGLRVESLQLPPSLTNSFKGPGFGVDGLRQLLGITGRPLLFTALKPMGLNSRELASLAGKFALGGIDIIKDDHGLTNQVYAPFAERVSRCAEAVRQANQQTGGNSIYIANVTGPADQVMSRARQAKEAGCGGLIIAPGLCGFDQMRQLAEDDTLKLPVISHPAFLGSYVTSHESGISHFALFGQMMRLAGADGVVYPNYGGRFSFSLEDCASIVEGCSQEMENIRTIFPCPGGGMSLDNVPEMKNLYGQDVMFLIGGGLFQLGPDLVQNCRQFKQLIEAE